MASLTGAATYNASLNAGTEFLNVHLYLNDADSTVGAETEGPAGAGADGTAWPSRVHQVAVGLILASICTVTVSGNLLVLVAVCISHNLRSTTHFFVANLACADLLLGTAVLPLSASLEVLDYWPFGPVLCDVWAALDVLCCTASILSLCVISIDRYIGVTRPLQHSLIVSEFRAAYVILGVWLLSVAISVAPLFGWKDPPGEDPYVCNVTRDTGYVLFSVSGSFYAPLAVILVVYFRVYREALNQSRFLATGVKGDERHGDVTLRCHTGSKATTPTRQALIGCGGERGSSYRSTEPIGGGGTGSHQSRETLVNKIVKFNREKKAAKTLGIVVGVFILCWFPFFFLLPLEAVCNRCAAPSWLFKVIFWLGYCNSTMNPIIYACSSRDFQHAFIYILRCYHFRRRRPSFTPRHHYDQRHHRKSLVLQTVSTTGGTPTTTTTTVSTASGDSFFPPTSGSRRVVAIRVTGPSKRKGQEKRPEGRRVDAEPGLVVVVVGESSSGLCPEPQLLDISDDESATIEASADEEEERDEEMKGELDFP